MYHYRIVTHCGSGMELSGDSRAGFPHATRGSQREESLAGKFSGRTRGYFKYPTNFMAHPEGSLRAAMKDQASRC